MIRKTLFMLVCSLLPLVASAQFEERLIVPAYDLDATSYTYCLLGPTSRQGVANITTSGSSTTVTAVDLVSTTPFTNVAATDMLSIDATGAVRIVTARASATSITVDSAIDLSSPTTGFSFSFRTLTCGTATNSGWFGTDGLTDKAVQVRIDQMNVTGGITFSLECKGRGPQDGSAQLWTQNFTSATFPDNGTVVVVPESCAQMRLGMKIGTADDGGDLTTNREQVTVVLTGERRAAMR